MMGSQEWDLVTCVNCGWVHMGISREKAQAEVDSFNEWFNLQPPEVQDSYGGKPSSIRLYEGCFHCGKKDFRETKIGDCPNGVTIQPVIVEGG